jgi:hypothetical protein
MEHLLLGAKSDAYKYRGNFWNLYTYVGLISHRHIRNGWMLKLNCLLSYCKVESLKVVVVCQIVVCEFNKFGSCTVSITLCIFMLFFLEGSRNATSKFSFLL